MFYNIKESYSSINSLDFIFIDNLLVFCYYIKDYVFISSVLGKEYYDKLQSVGEKPALYPNIRYVHNSHINTFKKEGDERNAKNLAMWIQQQQPPSPLHKSSSLHKLHTRSYIQPISIKQFHHKKPKFKKSFRKRKHHKHNKFTKRRRRYYM